MAQHTLPNPAYNHMRKVKETSHDDYYGLYMDAMRALHDVYFDQLQLSHLSVFLFILGRTLRYNKIAQAISTGQFINGVHNIDGVTLSRGTGLSLTTVRSSTAALSELGLIEAYRCGLESRGAPTLYEINCKNLLGFAVFNEKTGMPIRELSTKRAQKNDEIRKDRGSKKQESPLPMVTREKNRSITQISKSSLSATRSAPAERPLSGRELVDQIQSKGRALRTSRIASAAAKPAHLVSREEMQAMLDQIMQMYHPDRPRVVITLKSFGMMRKQLKTHTLPDLQIFLDRTVANWTEIHSQHSRARSKQARNGDTSALKNALPAAFDFDTLAYRLSYFVKVFTTSRVNSTSKVRQDCEKDVVDQLKSELSRTRQTLAQTQVALVRQSRFARPGTVAELSDVSNDLRGSRAPRRAAFVAPPVRTRQHTTVTLDVDHQQAADSFAAFVNEVAPK